MFLQNHRLLIKNGKIVTDTEILEKDVFIADGVIKNIGDHLQYGGMQCIDARDMYVIPGGIDPHTHFSQEVDGSKTYDDFYTGTTAALSGGTTMIMDFVLGGNEESLVSAYENRRKLADLDVCCDYSLHVGIKSWCPRKTPGEMSTLRNKHGVNSFQFYMSDDYMLTNKELYAAIEEAKNLGALSMIHAENGEIIQKNLEKIKDMGETRPIAHALIRPPEVEAEAIHRACVIAKQVNSPLYFTQIMSQQAQSELKRCRDILGVKALGETLAVALALDYTIYDWCYETAAAAVCTPALGHPGAPEALMRSLADGSLEVVSSGHTAFCKCQKNRGKKDFTKIPPGVNGVEERMTVVWQLGVETGMLDPCKFVQVTSSNAAKIFNIYPKKGCIAVGSDADIVVWDPKAIKIISAKTHHSASDLNVFEGFECHGVPEYVISRGKLLVERGNTRICRGNGRFVECQPFPNFVFGCGLASRGLLTAAEERRFQEALVKAEQDKMRVLKELEEMQQASSGDKPYDNKVVKCCCGRK